MKDKGPYSALADAVHAQREAALAAAKVNQQRHAGALRALATELAALARRAREIPGTYRIWARLADAQTEAEDLAAQWEARKR